MSITQVGTPSTPFTIGTNRTTASPVTGVWSGTQPRNAGDLLVAVVSAIGSTSAGATAQNTGTTGWVKQLEVFSGGASGLACVAVWTKTAAGSDAAPSFTSAISGTAVMACVLYELAGANTATPVDTSGTFASAAATITSESATTSGNVAAAGEFAIGVFARERSANTYTITASGTGYGLDVNDGSTSSVGHTGVISNPSPGSGATSTGGIAFSGTGTTSSGAGILAVFAAAPVPAGSQPGGASASRREVRAVWGGAYAPVPVPPKGTVPLHLVVARRSPARALWQGTAVRTVNSTAPPPSGSTQPRAAVPVPRRAAARAVWRGTVTLAVNAAPPVPVTVQLAHGFVSSRRPVGGLAGGAYTPQGNASGPAGTVQPRPAALLPRRYPSRAGYWRSAAGAAPAGTGGPAGTVQPRATVPVPRRYPARVLWGGQSTPQPHVPGQVQPRATVPLPRRYPSRAVWRGGTSAASLNGTVQPRAAVAVPRRYPARALWQSVIGAVNAHGPSGTVQPRAAVPVPRRAAARVLWHGAAGPANAHGPAGAAPGGLTARRPHPRAVWRGTTVVTVNNTVIPPGTPPRHLVVARRSPARASARWTPVATVNAPPVTAAVPAQRPVIPRRAPSRAVVHGNPVPGVRGTAATGGEITRRVPSRAVTRGGPAPPPPPSGTVQPPATAPARRHQPSRVVWRGAAVPGQQPRPATGGLVRRRATARGQWHGNTGTAPPPVPSAAPATGGRIATRRPPNRGQWRGTVTRTANAHGPSGSVQPKPVVARRAAARAWWRGSAPQAGYPASRVRFTVPYARQLWTAGTARQLWAAGTARQLWSVPSARNN